MYKIEVLASITIMQGTDKTMGLFYSYLATSPGTAFL